jgi:two-component system cell cycle response regulator DivK
MLHLERNQSPFLAKGILSVPAKRVLYIEDNAMNMRLVRRLLTANGYTVIEANDGLKGIAVAARERPDLILMDINLPGIDGMEATSRLKSSYDMSHIPIVALTAVAMKGDRERILAAGCDDYLQKPIDNALLIETVRRFIGEGEPKAATPVVKEPTTTLTPSTPSEAPRVVFVHKAAAITNDNAAITNATTTTEETKNTDEQASPVLSVSTEESVLSNSQEMK